MTNITKSRISASFRSALMVIVVIATYIKGQGGIDNIDIWEMIIFFGSVFGVAADGYHVPSALVSSEPQEKKSPVVFPEITPKPKPPAVPDASRNRGFSE